MLRGFLIEFDMRVCPEEEKRHFQYFFQHILAKKIGYFPYQFLSVENARLV
jgi:hypothetical protein